MVSSLDNLPKFSNLVNNELSGQPGKTSRECVTRGYEDLGEHLGFSSSPQNPSEHPYRIQNESNSSPSPHYLDLVDNVSSTFKVIERSNWLSATCDNDKGYFIRGEDESGHSFAKELVCNKEWCSFCGEDESTAHNRRLVRWMSKIQQFESLGYFVFTIPDNIRFRFRTKKALVKLGHDVQEILKSHGFDRGLRRYHFFGDESTKWHPHLNVLVDGRFIDKRQIKAIKREYAQTLGVSVVSVRYSYRPTPGKMIHSLRYTTRATFRDYLWDPQMALELRGFRNMVVWGRGLWKDSKGVLNPEDAVWSMDDVSEKERELVPDIDIDSVNKLGNGKCPICGKDIHWQSALPIQLLREVNKFSYGAGYYRLDDIPKHKLRPRESIPIITDRQIAQARGNYERITKHVANYLDDLVEVAEKITHKKRSRYFDPYWDDPNSEGYIEPVYDVIAQ